MSNTESTQYPPTRGHRHSARPLAAGIFRKVFHKTHPVNKRTAILSIVGAAFVVIAGVLWQAVSVSIEAEKTLHAYNLTLDVVGRFITEHGGAWPENWKALASASPTTNGMVWNWPGDIEEIRKRVKVDFSLETKEVAAMRVDEFKAIQELGPRYGASEPAVRRLVEIAQNATR